MSARLYTTVYDPADLPTEVAHIASKSLGTVNGWTELEYQHHRKGTGSLKGKINRHHPQAALLVEGRYVIVHSDAGPIGGAWLEEAPIDLSAAKGKGDEWAGWQGRGAIAILERGRLLAIGYSTDPAATSPVRGNFDTEGVWDWLDPNADIYYGGVLSRSVEEGQDQPGNPLAVVSMWGTDGFDRRDNDASGTPWTGLAEAFRIDIGTDVLDLVERFSGFGVISQMSYLFKLDAYNEPNFGTDRSGAFGAATVRLEKGENIAASIQRKVRGEVSRTHLLVAGADYTYVEVVHPDYVSGPAHWGFLSVPETSDLTDLTAIGLAHLSARDAQTDAWVLPLKHHGDDPASGIYEPAPDIADGHFWVGDEISFHTGTGEYDANEQSAPVAAITWQLKTGDEANGDYRVIVEVGSTFHWEGSKSFGGTVPGSQNRLILCPYDAGIIEMGTSWKALNIIGDSPPAGWNEVGFDDSAWTAVEMYAGGGSYSMPMGTDDVGRVVPSDEILLRKEFYIEPEDLSGADVTFKYALDNAGVIYVNGVAVRTLGPNFTNTAGHYTGDHATTLSRSTFRAGYNVVAIYVNNDAAGSVGATPPGATSAGIYVDIPTTNGQGTSAHVMRCDRHFHASEIDENNYGNVQAAIDAVLSGSGGLPWFNVKSYGALGDGSTDDLSAVNDAIAALNSAGRGRLYFPASNYLVTAGLDAITVPCLILGDGHAGGGHGMSSYASRIVCSSGSATLFDIQTHAYGFEGLALIGSAATPTAGAGIAITAAGDHGRFRDISVQNFYINIDIQEGAEWSMSGCHLRGPVKYALKIRHIDLPDGGDWAISDCQFIARTHDADAAIRIESAGGGKIVNCKVNAATVGGGFNHGIDVANAGGITTSILLVSNCSIENVRGDGIHATSATGSGLYKYIIVNGCQFGLYSNNSGKAISLVSTDAGDLSDCVIANSAMATDGTARSAIQLTNCNNVTLVGNVLDTNFTSLYTNSGSTNVVEIGGGITDHGALGGLGDDDHEQYLNEARHDALAHAGVRGLLTVDAGTPSYSVVGADVVTTITSKWGYDADGPYFDDAGVVSGEEAILALDPDVGDLAVIPYNP